MPADGRGPRRSVAVVTCYWQPDYVRAITLRDGLRRSGVFDEVIVVKNREKGLARYLDVTRQLWRMRANRPDAYLVTFRGYEILPIVLALAGGRPVVFDEFVNPVEWFVHEHHKFGERSLPARVLRMLFRRWSLRSRAVLADTATHADFSARLLGIDRSHYVAVPVGTDEQTFRPRERNRPAGAPFTVLYYGSMLPLHGLQHVLDAAVALRDRDDIDFRLVGGDAQTTTLIDAAVARGARVRHDVWIDYERLPELMTECDLFLAGPFGGTVQSQYVITGKTFQFLNSGVPTVIGRNDETAVFTDKLDALVVEQGSAQALAEAIQWAAAHPGELAAIGACGRELYQRRYSSDAIARAIADVPWGF